MIRAVRDGFRLFKRSWGLAFLLLATNVLLAAVLAIPFQGVLESELKEKDAAFGMMYGFDYPWWSEWSDRQSGTTESFGPDILGVGFVFKNVDLLLKGDLPAHLFTTNQSKSEDEDASDHRAEAAGMGIILGLAALYLLLQTFLAGGVLSVLRGSQGEWKLRALFHGSSFYFGRLLRVALVALAADFLLFRLNMPFARWVDGRAREAVSETTAMMWLSGRHALLLLALLFLHMLSSYAKVILVLEERASAVLAFWSSLGFCLRNLGKTWGLLLSVLALGVLLLLGWSSLDAHWATTGYKTQMITLLLFEGFILGRIVLRLVLTGGQISLYRSEALS